MKQIGLLPSQQLASLERDAESNWLNVPDGQTVVPLVKTEKPAVSAGIDYKPKLVWFADRAERQWEQVSVVSAPHPAPEATRLQVRLFLRRRGIDPETIPALIASVTAEGEEREEALERWKSTQSFPKAYPLVNAVAALLSLNLDEVWDGILAIE